MNDDDDQRALMQHIFHAEWRRLTSVKYHGRLNLLFSR